MGARETIVNHMYRTVDWIEQIQCARQPGGDSKQKHTIAFNDHELFLLFVAKYQQFFFGFHLDRRYYHSHLNGLYTTAYGFRIN